MHLVGLSGLAGQNELLQHWWVDSCCYELLQAGLAVQGHGEALLHFREESLP